MPLGRANSVLLEGDDGGLALVDAGYPGHEAAIFDALRTLGRHPEDLRHLVFTHAHPDHLGCAAAVVERTGAKTWIHSTDAPIAESGGPFRPMRPAPGLVQQIGFRLFFHANEPIAPVRIDRFEDRERGRRSQRQLASLDFEAMAFGHGGAIPREALRRVQRKWGSRP